MTALNKSPILCFEMNFRGFILNVKVCLSYLMADGSMIH